MVDDAEVAARGSVISSTRPRCARDARDEERIGRCLALSPAYEVPDESREGSIDPPAENLAEVTGLI